MKSYVCFYQTVTLPMTSDHSHHRACSMVAMVTGTAIYEHLVKVLTSSFDSLIPISL